MTRKTFAKNGRTITTSAPSEINELKTRGWKEVDFQDRGGEIEAGKNLVDESTGAPELYSPANVFQDNEPEPDLADDFEDVEEGLDADEAVDSEAPDPSDD